jgi:CheY-like chemotaxis protein
VNPLNLPIHPIALSLFRPNQHQGRKDPHPVSSGSPQKSARSPASTGVACAFVSWHLHSGCPQTDCDAPRGPFGLSHGLKQTLKSRTRSAVVADDDGQVRYFVRLVLAHAGYSVREAVNGKDALEKLATQPADLLVTDLMMPDVDGIELIRSVRSIAGTKSTRYTLTHKRRSRDIRFASPDFGPVNRPLIKSMWESKNCVRDVQCPRCMGCALLRTDRTRGRRGPPLSGALISPRRAPGWIKRRVESDTCGKVRPSSVPRNSTTAA